MARIDEIKEILNTLRITMSIAFGILVVLVGSIIKRFDTNNIDTIFWLGVAFTFVVLIFIILVVVKISDRTKEIMDLATIAIVAIATATAGVMFYSLNKLSQV